MSWLAYVWAWLDVNSKQIGALSSMVFGISGLAVAIFAYRLNRRNNWGHKPVVLIPTLGGKTQDDEHFSTFEGEVWNRRKYTIYPKMVRVKFRSVGVAGLLATIKVFQGEWMLMSNGWWVMQAGAPLKTEGHMTFEGSFPIVKGVGFELPLVKVDYFDPMVADNLQIRGRWRQRYRFHRWHLPMLVRVWRGKAQWRRISATQVRE